MHNLVSGTLLDSKLLEAAGTQYGLHTRSFVLQAHLKETFDLGTLARLIWLLGAPSIDNLELPKALN